MLAWRHGRAALLVIATYRPLDVILRGHPVKVVKQELQIHGLCTELVLDTLSRAEVAGYLVRRFPRGEIPQGRGAHDLPANRGASLVHGQPHRVSDGPEALGTG